MCPAWSAQAVPLLRGGRTPRAEVTPPLERLAGVRPRRPTAMPSRCYLADMRGFEGYRPGSRRRSGVERRPGMGPDAACPRDAVRIREPLDAPREVGNGSPAQPHLAIPCQRFGNGLLAPLARERFLPHARPDRDTRARRLVGGWAAINIDAASSLPLAYRRACGARRAPAPDEDARGVPGCNVAITPLNVVHP